MGLPIDNQVLRLTHQNTTNPWHDFLALPRIECGIHAYHHAINEPCHVEWFVISMYMLYLSCTLYTQPVVIVYSSDLLFRVD